MIIRDGRYTIKSMSTGNERTIKVKTQGEDAKFAPGERVVALLSGKDNTTNYTGFGFIRSDSCGEYVQIWRRKLGEDGKRSPWEFYGELVQLAATALKEATLAPQDDAVARFGVKVAQDTREYEVALGVPCLVCGRPLTRMESIRRGMGSECAEKMGDI